MHIGNVKSKKLVSSVVSVVAYRIFFYANPEIPEKATVGWTTPDGKKNTAKVEVKSKMPPGDSKLNIIFTINADNTVTVSYE